MMSKEQRLKHLEADVEKLSSKIDEVNDKILLLLEAIRNAKLDAINMQTTRYKRSNGLID